MDPDDSVDWTSLFQENGASDPIAPKAVTYRRSWDSACGAVQVSCDDEEDYVIKGCQAGRSVFNDQVVGRIACALGAPVAEVCLVDVPAELIRINPRMTHVAPGLSHGSRFIVDCTECLWIQHQDELQNRPRFALLSVLYGWMVAVERQFFYSTAAPYLVYSFDHDAFFPRGPNWSEESLGGAEFPDADDVIYEQCGLSNAELRSALHSLATITPKVIASAIAAVPDALGNVTLSERVTLAQYLWERCQTMRS